ncbi:hypothetical protein IW262DRAFT_1450136 [Armillaria fumosa]|nr:hypothetical protein IW262DRAFT_1450136 [Armillaria fumosa]
MDERGYEDQMNAEVFESSIFQDNTTEVQWSSRSKASRWTGLYFTATTLKAIGLCVQLNHQSLQCPVPVPCHVKLRILHTTGIHDVAHIQLLRRGWYPASQQVRMSDNTGLNTPPSHRAALMRMLIQWRHLRLLKRGRWAHDVTGPEGTKPGELAVLCPSCPQPGINLPSDWDQAPPHLKFLYLLLICINTNFRLKNQIVSSYSRDPGLSIGWLYFTAHEPYEDYVRSRAMDADISTCVEFSTMAKSNTKFSKGLRYTGVIAISCGRSEMVLPTCVGNMDKGKRCTIIAMPSTNVDPLAAAAICQFSDLVWVIISYDIACQWIKTIFTRMTSHWPSKLRFNPDIRITPLVPKFHEPGHKVEEHEQFSFNLAEGVGLSDGECPEWIWAGHNALGNSTKTVGPGTRQDLIDDHLGFWNWVKYCCMGEPSSNSLGSVFIVIREEVHRGFTQSLLPDMVSEWDNLCVAWEADKVPKMVLNPFCVQSDDLTEDEVHKELAEEEEARRRSGGRAVYDMSPSAFMVFELRATYMPGLLQFVSETQEVDDSSAGTVAEEVQLWLPSSILADRRGQVCGLLSDMEERLHTAQCHDALNSVRHILHLKMQMVEYKNKNVRGQWDGTRLQAGIDAIHKWALAAALKYRMAREAKLQLSGPGDWERTLCKLEDNDICSYQDPDHLQRGTGRQGTNEDSWGPGSTPEPVEHGIDLYRDDREKQDGTGQTWRSLSWIWITTKINLEDRADKNNNEVLCSEWCRSRARVHRAHEEVLLLWEEMRRSLKFLEWRGECDLQHKIAVKFWDTWSTALKNTLMDELDHKDDINEDAEDEDVGIWDDKDEQELELDDEDFAGL